MIDRIGFLALSPQSTADPQINTFSPIFYIEPQYFHWISNKDFKLSRWKIELLIHSLPQIYSVSFRMIF